MNLKETFEFLAVEAGDPPPAVADRALAQVRWNRAVRAFLLVVVLAGTGAVAYAWPATPPQPPQPPKLTNPPGVSTLPPRQELRVGQVRLGGYTLFDTAEATFLLDPRTGTYRSLPSGALISPDGRKALYTHRPEVSLKEQTKPQEVGSVDRITVVDLATGAETVIPLQWGGDDFAWSPDSGTILGTVTNAVTDPVTGVRRRVGFYLISPGGSQPDFVPVSQGGCRDARPSNSFGWRGGEVWAVSPGTTSDTCTLTYYGLDGAAHRSLAVPGAVLAVSPNGGLLLTRHDKGLKIVYGVVDATTGQQVGTFPAERDEGVTAALTPSAWVDDRHLAATQGTHGTDRLRLVVTDVNGQVTKVESRWGPPLIPQFIPDQP